MACCLSKKFWQNIIEIWRQNDKKWRTNIEKVINDMEIIEERLTIWYLIWVLTVFSLTSKHPKEILSKPYQTLLATHSTDFFLLWARQFYPHSQREIRLMEPVKQGYIHIISMKLLGILRSININTARWHLKVLNFLNEIFFSDFNGRINNALLDLVSGQHYLNKTYL